MSPALLVLVVSLHGAPVEEAVSSRPFAGPITPFQVASLSFSGLGMASMLTGVWMMHFSTTRVSAEQATIDDPRVFDVGQGLLLGGSLATLTGVGLYLLGEKLRLDALQHVTISPTVGGAQVGVHFTW